MKTHRTLLLAATLLSFAVNVFAETAASQKPNVVLIFTDDLGYGDVGCYGASLVQTPNIDRLAEGGRRFTDAHSASAVCTPSRYALLTGEYPFRANNGRGTWGPLRYDVGLLIPTDTFTIGKLFQAEGYTTSCFGKWHLGWGDQDKNDWSMPLGSGPNELGFDYYWGIPRVNCNPPYVFVENNMIVGYDPEDPLVLLKKGETPTPIRRFPKEASTKGGNRFRGAVKAHELYDDEMVGTRLTEQAVGWIEANNPSTTSTGSGQAGSGQEKKPFFLLFNTTNIHHPFTPAPRFKGTSQCGLYGDFIHELDWMVGELMRCLEENGLSDNTLVIFTSDNGGMFNIAAQNAFKDGHQINGDLLGFKFGGWEGGHRVPFIASWPGKIPAGTVSDQLICSIDMMATFAAITGQTIDPVDSVNMLPALVGNPQKPVREELVLAAVKSSHLSLRKGKWIYIPEQGSGGFNGTNPGAHDFGGAAAASFTGHPNSDVVDGEIKAGAPPAQLYDLEADVNQTHNLYHDYPEVVEAMRKELQGFRESVK
ncbi:MULTISPECIES: sulfatase-like hydrolase/transferase [unclassified Lentimonas]|uniref:sulfatase-like hydrolase/transferase n=1 Tax=unclassified Lentimonas TaxID=2630993 RepID=UPI00132317B1|nr:MULTISPECIES: sulfatase-like hydrolase/transferase [unclassified Lentimonas]CAA6677830.1 Choline-sulfatase (EC [Lentimonas sp. CC4]CAA6683932.1 Choline-sulfatase (EC [Lentimonas sp. CC6]CAA7076690.1 Choline-sulfatase (EC [Lentimonas sp. CC4]CAA7169978.1 Choline-sulfatase (EC [Lentimonas sp. CC21]CAA7181265.1 Choline-sulfatase (EC [Lentimonas sp. CC8]